MTEAESDHEIQVASSPSLAIVVRECQCVFVERLVSVGESHNYKIVSIACNSHMSA